MSYDRSHTIRNLYQETGLDKILALEGLTEVAINQPFQVWFDRGNGWEKEDNQALDYDTCFKLAKALTVYSGFSLVLGHDLPIASVVLPDGERGQIAVPPVTKKGIVSISIRKPSTARFSLSDYEKTGRLNTFMDSVAHAVELTDSQQKMLDLKAQGKMAEFFEEAVKSLCNILIVGGTGSGKTTVMKALVDKYPADKRIFTIEDVPEVDLPNHKNHLNLFYKQGGVTAKNIIESCMRMKPDHVMLAELRGDEAWSYIEMLNTGHQGSITTIHANDCQSAYSRLANLVKQSEVGQTLDLDHILNTIHTSIDVIAFFKGTYLTELHYDPATKNKMLSEMT